MPLLKENAFTFESEGLPGDTFSVVRFNGEEGLSQLYRFEIQLISETEEIDATAVLQNPATFTIQGHFANGPELPFHGILSAFEQMHQYGPYTFYRAELRPRLWWLTLTHHNQVFLNKTTDAFLTGVLEDGGLARNMDFEFRLRGGYSAREYVCQFGESHFDFVSRWMEREGAYYWFEQNDHREKMIASDTRIAHAPLPGHETFLYSPPSGLDYPDADKVIKRFTLKQTPMPRNVLLRDYNYLKPSLALEGKAQVQEQGRGEIYLYGDHFPDKEEGRRLAAVRAEEYRCREKVFHGLSHIPALRPGYLFSMERHYRQDFNQQYLTTSVHHEGSQERFLVSGLGVTDVEDRDGLFYRNTFTCIPGSTQYRPERKTPRPRIAGSLSAKIDAAGSGQYAELDEHGRYKVILPFDMSGRKDGKASAWVRMMQPYAGPGMGFHAPLHKGTEVLLAFIEADPDRPVIAGAIPNPENPSPVNDENQTQVRLVSGSGNVIHMEDQEGKQRILLHSPTHGSFVRVGAHNDPSPAFTDDGLSLYTTGGFGIRAQAMNSIIMGESSETVIGASIGIKMVDTFGFVGGGYQDFSMGGKICLNYPEKWEFGFSEKKLAEYYMKILQNEVKAIGQHLAFMGQKETVVGSQTNVAGQSTGAVAERSDVAGSVSSAVADTVQVSASQTVVAGDSISVAASSVDAQASRIESAGTVVSDSAVSVQNSGSQIVSAGTQISSSGTAIQNSALALRSAPVILDN